MDKVLVSMCAPFARWLKASGPRQKVTLCSMLIRVPLALCLRPKSSRILDPDWSLIAVCCFLVPKPFGEYCPGTSDSWAYHDRTRRTVHCTGTAFHAAISVYEFSNPTIHCKYCVPAYQGAHTAAGASFPVELQGHNVIQISKPHSLLVTRCQSAR